MSQISKLCLTISEKKFSQSTDLRISEIIRDTVEERKEETAMQILGIVNSSKSEQEVLQKLREQKLLQ